MNDIDQGKHYRFQYIIKVTKEDLDRGFIRIKLDPFRIADIYKMKCKASFTALKKVLRMGTGGHKDEKQDCLDVVSAMERKLEMLDEDDYNKID